jgi:predicted nucleic acid-binding protein
MAVVVADAGPIIALSAVGCLDLLQGLYGRIIVPRAVLNEVLALPGAPGSEVAERAWVDVNDEVLDNDPVVVGLMSTLDLGEACAIALAARLQADLCLIDERRGRAVARQLGVRIKGTIGVLVDAKHRGLLQEVAPVLKALRDAGVFLSDAVVAAALREADEPTVD